MDRRSFIIGGLAGLLGSLYSGNEALSLDTEVKDTKNEFPIDFTKHYNDTKERIVTVLDTVKEKGYDLSKVYDEDSPEDNLQTELRLGTRTLSGYVHSNLIRVQSGAKKEVEDYIPLLEKVRDVFGDHPFHHVVEGRLKEAVNWAHMYKFSISEEFQDYVGSEIPPWQSPHLNYRTLDDLRNSNPERNALQYIPPEFRKP